MKLARVRGENAFFHSVMVTLALLVVVVNIGWIFPTPNNFFTVIFKKLFGPKVTVVHSGTDPSNEEPVNIWDPLSQPPPKP